MRQAITLLFILAVSTVLRSQSVVDSILHDGIYRTYRLFVPPGFVPAENPAIVFNLHGLGSNAEQQEAYSLMNDVAMLERFLVCYADGENNSWNLGLGQVDDIGLIGALIDRFTLTHNVDPQRVYACGMSQGGYFSFVLSCQLADRIAAIATVSASMAQGLPAFCNPPRPVPVFMINGTADAIVPYTGGVQNIAVNDAIAHWVAHNGCATPAVISPIPDAAPTDGCTASRADFGGCTQGTEVDLIAVTGGGHTWPGATIPIGVTCQDFDASTEIWLFFERFTLNGAVTMGEAPLSFSSVHPVPADQTLTVRLRDAERSYLSMTDAVGRINLGSMVVDGAQLDVSGLPAGRYTATISSALGDERHSVVIVR